MERYLLRVATILMAWLAAVSLAWAQTAVEYIHTDALGTPVAVTNSASMVIERSVYEPYGQLVNRPLTDGPGYTGHVQDDITGLTYMQQRYYDPQVGIFLSVDPVTEYSSGASMYFNRYRYAASNQYTFIDADGRRNGRANPNPTYSGMPQKHREILVGLIAKKYLIDMTGIDVFAPPGGAGGAATAQGLFVWEGEFVTQSRLAGTIGHEVEIHYILQYGKRGESYGLSPEAEIEAYEYNLKNAKRFGNTEQEIEYYEGEIRRYRAIVEQREKERKKRELPKRDPEEVDPTRDRKKR